MTSSADVVVIGGGLVGLSTAMHLQTMLPGVSIALCEKEARVAAHQSSRNSGVLHAGIYYEPGSLKARLCVEGNRALGEFCEKHEIALTRCGKVIVANSDAEFARLDVLAERGTVNGVPGLRVVSGDELAEIEPHVAGGKALYAPNSAIVDYEHVARTYARIFEEAGGQVLLNTELRSSQTDSSGLLLKTTAGVIQTKLAINCAGLYADTVAIILGSRPKLKIIPFRGEFYRLIESRRSLVRGLIYPVPNPALPFLDVHLTLRVDGSVDAGPNAVLAMKREGYRWSDISLRDTLDTISYPGFWRLAAREFGAGIAEINRSLRRSVFVKSLKRLVPEITSADLEPAPSGVRAMAVNKRGDLVDDFYIEEAERAIHVLNAPSPAATSSLMIGKHVANIANPRINAACNRR